MGSFISHINTAANWFMSCLFGNCGYQCPETYLYTLTSEQKKIIVKYLKEFYDVKYLSLKTLDFDLSQKKFVVKRGFATDGVSSGMMCSNWIYVNTAVMHDFLYATHPLSRYECDKVLFPRYRRIITNLFGGYAWKSSGKRGSLFIRRDSGGVTQFLVYHDAYYYVITHSVVLPSSEGALFDPFFEQLSLLSNF